MKTVVPATPTDAYGLLVTAIRDDDPVVFFAPTPRWACARTSTSPTLAPVPLGVGRVHRQGDDVTVVAVGHLVQDALAVAEELADEVSVEVFDPRTHLPVRLGRPGRVGGPHRPARRGRRRQPVLRHRG